MGDVLPPKNNHAVERLTRRVSGYRTHQDESAAKYELYLQSASEHERQSTAFLQQRYLDSKSKKTKKDHRTYKESVSDANKSQVAKPPVKRPAEDTVYSLPQNAANDEGERPAKLSRTENLSERKPDLQISTQNGHTTSHPNIQSSPRTTLPSLSVQIVPQFNQQPALKPTIQTNVTVQNLTNPSIKFSQPVVPNNSEVVSNTDDNSLSSANNLGLCNSNVECKKESEGEASELVPLEALPSTNLCDGLTDTFSSIGKKENSPDEAPDILPNELLQNLLDEISPTERENFMNDFFEADGSIKNINNAKADSLIKDVSCQPEKLSFTSPPTNQQLTGMTRSLSCGEENVLSSISANTLGCVTTSVQFSQQHQNIQPYMNPGVECMQYSYKMEDPTGTLAARALKQMAEQHQSSQKQQIWNSSISNRPPFTQENSFSNPINNRSPNFISATNMQSNEKMASPSSNIYSFEQLPDDLFASIQNNCSRSPSFDVSELRLPANQFELHKPPPYSTARPLSQYNENSLVKTAHQNMTSNNPPMVRAKVHIQNSSDLRFQLPQQTQQNSHLRNINLGQIREGENKMLSHPSQFTNCHHLSYSQFSPTLPKPPPEYKASHHSVVSGTVNMEQLNPSQSMCNMPHKSSKLRHPSPNVTITADGLAVSSTQNWRLTSSSIKQLPSHPCHQQSHLQNHLNTFVPTYNTLSTGVQQNNGPLSPSYNQYRPAVRNIMQHNHLQRQHLVPQVVLQQRHQNVGSQCQRSPLMGVDSTISVNTQISNNNSLSNGPFNSPNHVINRNNCSNQINLEVDEIIKFLS